MEEANKLIGLGKKHLVMGKVVEAVSTLQEACDMLAKKFGDTADECGEAFYWCGKALLDLARMENSVLGNALQGVPDEEEDTENPKDSNVEMESTDNLDEKTRDELRVQVYDAMAEKKEEASEKDGKDLTTEKTDATEKTSDMKDKKTEDASENKDDAKAEGDQSEKEQPKESSEKEQTKEEQSEKEQTKEESPEKEQSKEPSNELSEKEQTKEKDAESLGDKTEDETAAPEKDLSKEAMEKVEVDAEEHSESEGNKENESPEMETDQEAPKTEEAEDGGDEEIEGDEDAGEMDCEKEKAEGEDTAEKESDDEEVGNLQLAWEMLEVAKVIYKRKETKEDQLMAAQAHLKLGEVSAESGNYTQAIEDFQECLKLQLTHLEPDSRLLAETYYQLGLTYSLNCLYKQAIDELNSSISVIKSRLEKLQGLIDCAEGPDALPEEKKELEELKALLPEIQEKVEDATEGLKTAGTDAEAVKGVLEGKMAAESGDKEAFTKTEAVAEQTAPASDISHLVRKKRKQEESPVKEVKKVKQDEASEEPQKNGTHANGQTNGHGKDMEVQSN